MDTIVWTAVGAILAGLAISTIWWNGAVTILSAGIGVLLAIQAWREADTAWSKYRTREAHEGDCA